MQRLNGQIRFESGAYALAGGRSRALLKLVLRRP
jgi:hypothetical protein